MLLNLNKDHYVILPIPSDDVNFKASVRLNGA